MYFIHPLKSTYIIYLPFEDSSSLAPNLNQNALKFTLPSLWWPVNPVQMSWCRPGSRRAPLVQTWRTPSVNFCHINTRAAPLQHHNSPEFCPLHPANSVSHYLCWMLQMPDTGELVLLWTKPAGTSIIKTTNHAGLWCFSFSNKQQRKPSTLKLMGEIRHCCHRGCSVRFKECDFLCVCFYLSFFFFFLNKQLQRAILHLPTLELFIVMAQTKKLKKAKKN